MLTSEEADASFDGKMSLTLHAADGGATSHALELPASETEGGAFAPGSKAVFRRRAAKALGRLSKVSVGLESTGSSSTWRGRQVEVVCEGSNTYGLFRPAAADTLHYYWNGAMDLELAPADADYEVACVTRSGGPSPRAGCPVQGG